MNKIVITGLVLFALTTTWGMAQESKKGERSGMQGMMQGMMGHQKSGEGTMQGMGGMMKQCSEHHEAMMKNMDEASKALEEAKQSNDPGKMRTAIDQAQKQLADMKEHMSMCGDMMNMMEKMHGMGGMMKGESMPKPGTR